MKYLERNLLDEIIKWMHRKEIIAIKGPRQSGKTTLLEMLQEWLSDKKGIQKENITFISFEDRDLLANFSLDPRRFVKRFIQNTNRNYFLIDEAHYCEGIGQKLKLLYDTYKDIKIIVTGSSSLELTSETSRFLVGRLFSFELLPFNFYEFLKAKDKSLANIYLERNLKIKDLIYHGKDFKIEKEDIFLKELLNYLKEYLIFGGYPEVVKGETEEEKKMILKNIFNTYVEKDIIIYLNITDVIKFKKLISMLAFTSGNMVSYEKLITNCNSYYKEIQHLLDVLSQTYIVKLLTPYHGNLVTELRKNPKVYFYDFGLRNFALNNFNSLDIRGDAGAIAENFVLNELENDNVSLNYWRTTTKAEVDFVISDLKRITPIEVKFEALKRPKITRSFHSFLNTYDPETGVVITKDYWGEKMVKNTKIKFIPIVYF